MDIETLVKKAQRGDEDSFIELIEIHKKLMYYVAKSMIKNDEDIADLIQDTILKSYKNIDKLKDTNGFKPWILKILTNNCRDFIRKNKKVLSLEDILTEEKSCDELENIEIKHAFDKLSKDLKIVAKLYYIEDVSVKNLAQILEVPEGTVKSRLYRARKELTEILSDRREEYERNIR